MRLGSTRSATNRDESITVRAPTRLARSATDPVEALPEVELDPTHEVTGTLVTDTTPVTHALVRAYRADHVSGDEILSQSWSDDAGHFGLQLPDGSNDVVVLTDSASPDVLGRTLAAQPIAGVTDLGEIALQRAGSVRQVQGRVVSQAGDAVAGAKATVFRWRATGPEMPGLAADAATSDDAEGEWVVAQTVTTDAAGRYRFEVNDQSVVTVRARRNGFRQGWLGSISKPSEPTAATSALVDNDRTLPELTLFPTADRIGKVWGLGSDTPKDPGPWEGELRNMWKPTQVPHLWIHGGNLHQSRHYSQFLSLQLKARLAGIPTPVYGLAPVHHTR